MQRRAYLPAISGEIESPLTAARDTSARRWWAASPVVTTLFASLSGLAAIYGVTRLETAPVVTVPAVIAAGGWLLVVAWRSWETGVRALLVVLVVEGAVRKWFVPSASEFVYFYKDLLMVVILAGYMAAKRRPSLVVKRQLKLFSVILAAFTIYVVASVSNPALPHPVVGVLGVKAYLLYVPLAFLVPRMFTSKEKLVAFLKWYVVIALPVAALGAMQFVDSDPQSAINIYAWDEKTMAAAGAEMSVANFMDSAGASYVRITGPFSYLSGMTIYLPVAFALLLGLVAQRRLGPLPKGFRWIYHLALAAVVTTAFMTGSRSVVLNLCITALLFYGLASKKDLFRRFRQAAVGAALVAVALTVFFPQAFDALYTRAFGGADQIEEGQGRIEEAFRLPLEEAAYAGAFGYGVGATQNATPALMSKLNLPFMGERIPIAYEAEPGRVMLELGVVGYLLHLTLRLGLLVTLLYACFNIRDAEARSLAVAAVAALLFPLALGGAVTQHTQNVFQWFLAGVPLAMLNAERLRPGTPAAAVPE